MEPTPTYEPPRIADYGTLVDLTASALAGALHFGQVGVPSLSGVGTPTPTPPPSPPREVITPPVDTGTPAGGGPGGGPGAPPGQEVLGGGNSGGGTGTGPGSAPPGLSGNLPGATGGGATDTTGGGGGTLDNPTGGGGGGGGGDTPGDGTTAFPRELGAPAPTTTTPADSGELPRTGGFAGALAAVGAALTGTGTWLRRRTRH